MKIQCDECGREACVFCTADEAALCQNCDTRIHNANKISRKHPRFSLQHPLSKESPGCDVCQVTKDTILGKEGRYCFVKKTGLYFVECVIFQYTEPMSTPGITAGFSHRSQDFACRRSSCHIPSQTWTRNRHQEFSNHGH
ncbi:B-box zinc finger family protein isoform 1 [Dorcoceras hygrometricum]|uniref:B-box zinc finger family protein isoform 1 n=1 Tax=Dorcoceras hygrometricum TaxID=472368 RepID=A0A2Z7B3Q8_9LAMI|nr:B-box zinc finger family protein isoform 1 [Dorcoceras hygrometricum]